MMQTNLEIICLNTTKTCNNYLHLMLVWNFIDFEEQYYLGVTLIKAMKKKIIQILLFCKTVYWNDFKYLFLNRRSRKGGAKMTKLKKKNRNKLQAHHVLIILYFCDLAMKAVTLTFPMKCFPWKISQNSRKHLRYHTVIFRCLFFKWNLTLQLH